jgi:hypothetical protein
VSLSEITDRVEIRSLNAVAFLEFFAAATVTRIVAAYLGQFATISGDGLGMMVVMIVLAIRSMHMFVLMSSHI